MKFAYLCLAALSAVAVSNAAFQDEATCVKATSDEAPVWGLFKIIDSLPASTLNIDTAALKDAVKSALTTIGSDDLDQCIGSMQPTEVITIAGSIISNETVKNHFDNIVKYTDTSESFKETVVFVEETITTLQGSDSLNVAALPSLLNKASTFFKSIEPKDVEEFCLVHEKDITPVFVSTLAPSLLSLFEKASSGCCDPLLAKLKTSLGTEDLEKFLVDAFKAVSNVVCDEISQGDETLRCGHRVVNSLLVDMMGDIPPFITLPNSESCKAFTGQEFTTVNGRKHTYPRSAKFSEGKDLNTCGKNMLDLTSMVSSVPAIKNMEVGEVKMSDLFGDETTVDTAALITEVLGKDAAGLVAGIVGAKLHIPTSVGECKFEYDTTVAPSTDSPDTPNSPDTPDAKPKVPETPTPKPTEGSNAPAQSFSALVSAVIMLFALMQLM